MAAPPANLARWLSDPCQAARRAGKDPLLVEALVSGLSADEVQVKYASAKALRSLSEYFPQALYPHFDFFCRLLDHENRILQWEAAFVLSHLVRADAENRFESIFTRYFSPIPGPVMITAANSIRGGARIARAKPHLADRVAVEIMKVGGARYQTPECRNVAIGHALLALGEMFDLLTDPTPVLRFVKRQLKNRRPATRKKAAQFLKRSQHRAKNLEA